VLTVPDWAPDALSDVARPSWRITLDPVNGPPVVLPVTAGTLRADAATYPRHTLDVSIGGLDLAPVTAADPLTPFGARLIVEYTLTDPTGRTFTIRPAPPLILDTVEVSRGDDVGIRLTGSDDSLAVDTDAYLVPTDAPASAQTVSALIAHLIRRTFPAAVIDDRIGSGRYVGNGWQVDGSPWAAIESLADSVGAECYVDPAGRFVLRPVPALGTPVATFATGPGGTITGLRSTIVRGYNRVGLVFRDDDGRIVRGLWADRSGGPLDVSGAYGRVSLSEPRDREASQSEADAAASRYARRAAGRVRDVEVTAPAAPWIETGDTVRVRFPSRPDDLSLLAVEHDVTGATASRYRFRTDTVGPV
jgi:hypothetical protein